MTQCNFMYASGLRIKEGDGVVVLDGKTLRVIRNGRGRSNMNLPLADPPSDGTIGLRDLKEELSRRGESSIELQVRDKTSDGSYLAFSVDLDPEAAMGRKGREGDFKTAINGMLASEQVAASLYQLRTLPDSDKQAGTETPERLRLAVEKVGGVAKALPHLDGRFGLLADQSLLDETLSYITSDAYEPSKRDYKPGREYKPGTRRWLSVWPSVLRDEVGPTVMRVAGKAISDPSRVSDEYFAHAVKYERHHDIEVEKQVEFADIAFDRLDDDSLRAILYRGLKWRSSRAEFTELITDPERLERIVAWDPDKNPLALAATIAYELTDGKSAHLEARWLADKARQLSAQFR